MAVVHVRTGGTKQATGAGDYASTADDWTLANCYDTLLKVGLSTQTGSPSTFIAAGDEIILYDENDTSNPTEHDADFVRLRDISIGAFQSRNVPSHPVSL